MFRRQCVGALKVCQYHFGLFEITTKVVVERESQIFVIKNNSAK